MTRKPPPHRRKRDPFRRQVLGVYHAPQSVPADDAADRPSPAGTSKPTTVPEWAVRHLGIGVLPYDTEDEARMAAGTAGQVLHWGQEVD